jgi:hypothetical protein
VTDRLTPYNLAISIASVHSAVAAARKCGILANQHCELCLVDPLGNKVVIAHHDDYNYPLRVRWLCRKHHKRWHRDNRATPLRPDMMYKTPNEMLRIGLRQFSQKERADIIEKLFH